MDKKMIMLVLGALMMLAGCDEEGSSDTDVEFEVMARSQSVAAEGFTNGAELVHDEDMLAASLEQSGADIDPDEVDFENERLFEVSITENGCGFTLVSIRDDGGTLEFMFELTPVAEGEADAGDVACTEIAVPAVFYVKTGPVDFHNLEVYGSGMKYE